MECEVSKEREESIYPPLVTNLEEQIKVATDQLLLTNFSACLDTCRHVVGSAAAPSEDVSVEAANRLSKVREEATVIGIQALAEQGSWKDVIPFVAQVYSHTASCPPAVMQMCLLLYAHMRQYMACHSLVNSWLDWGDHGQHPQSGAVVAVYVTNVLIPLRAYNLIPQVVERCTVLTPEQRQTLLCPMARSSLQPTKHHCGAISDSSDLTDHDDPSVAKDNEETDHRKSQGVHVVISMYLRTARRLCRYFAKRGWCQNIRKVSKLIVLVSFVLLAIMHVQTDVTANFARAMEIWKTAIGAVSSLWTRQPGKLL